MSHSTEAGTNDAIPAPRNVDISPANMEICKRFCGSCPTYRENSLNRENPTLLFCGQGKSGKGEIVKKTCNCPKCGVHSRYGLTGEFYCSG